MLIINQKRSEYTALFISTCTCSLIASHLILHDRHVDYVRQFIGKGLMEPSKNLHYKTVVEIHDIGFVHLN